MSTSILFMGKTYSSLQAMPADLREAYQSKPIELDGTDYASVEAMPPDVRAAFEAAVKKDPDEYDDWLSGDDEDDPDDDTAAPAWGGARPAGSVPVPAGFEAVTGLGPAVEAHLHHGLNILPHFGLPHAAVLVRFRDGFAFQAGDKSVHAWPYGEVTVIQTAMTRHPEKNNAWTSHEFTFTKQNGEQLILDDGLKGVWDAAEYIKTAVFKLLRPPLKQRYEAGEALTFGPVTVHKQNGLTLDGKLYAWASIADVKVEHGQLKVTLSNKQKHQAHTAMIPNIELLCQLIGVQLDDEQLRTEGIF